MRIVTIALVTFLLLMLSSTTALLFSRTLTIYSKVSACPSIFQSIVVGRKSSSHHFAAVAVAMSGGATSSDEKEALLNCPSVTLANGRKHPMIGFGTYKVGFVPSSASSTVASAGQRSAEECVKDALDVGYRFIECAEFYGNEACVGRAIRSSNIPRSELFLTSKVWTTTMEKGSDAILSQVRRTLQDLHTDYLDLYLIHWPVPNGVHIETYRTLAGLVQQGHIRGIGLSNYSIEDYQELVRSGVVTKEIPPLVNQIEINPFLYRKKTIEFFQEEGIVLQSYRSLRDGKVFDHETLKKMAATHDKTTAQILGRWCIQKNLVYIPKSVRRDRMRENSRVFDFELSAEEMDELDALTTEEALHTFQELYRKCVNRDTSKDSTLDGVKMNITIH